MRQKNLEAGLIIFHHERNLEGRSGILELFAVRQPVCQSCNTQIISPSAEQKR